MTLRCENCGHPLLEDDIACVHCGTPSPREPVPEPAPEKEQINLRAAGGFAVMVIGLAILGIVLLNWVGAGYSSPLQPTPTPAAPAGWRQFTPPRADYVIWLPDSWQARTPSSPQWDAWLNQLAHPLPDSFAKTPPTGLDERLSLIASDPKSWHDPAPTVSVQLHPGLGEISLGILQTDNWWASDRWVDTGGGISFQYRDSGETLLIADLLYPNGAGEYIQSVTSIIKTNRGAYAVTVSALEPDFRLLEEQLWQILDSFRPLDPDLQP